MSVQIGAPIEFRQVSKSFRGASHAAVEALDLTINAGELMVLVGPSGCGKTTTLRLINRLLEPTAGTVLVDGLDTATLRPEELRREIGYVIQHVGLFPHRTVAHNIGTVPKLLGWPAAEIAKRVDELAEDVGLDRGLLERYPAELSGGQQQRVGVARALAARPRILLMDEPYSAVDPVVRGRLQVELRQLHQRLGTTIVLVTHDIDEAIRLGDRVAVFSTGRVAQVASPDELLAHPANSFVEEFLGANRSLRRLALRTLGEILGDQLSPHPSPQPSDNADPDNAHRNNSGRNNAESNNAESNAVSLDIDTPARDAVDALVETGADSVRVEQGGRLVGRITLADLTDALSKRLDT